jgi:4-carboxymuconolactone decarboxylase
VSDALADHVVDRHERAVAAERRRHARRDSLDSLEQRSHQIGIEIGQRDGMPLRCDQHMTLEHRRPIEKRDRDIIVQHRADRECTVDRVAEQAGWFDHARILTLSHDEIVATNPRITPVTSPTEEVIELFNKAGLRAPDGSTLNIFGTLAHHPALLRRWLVFATHVLAKNSLTPRDRELLILRTGWRCTSQYEFSQHAVIALRCDISDEEVQRTKLPVTEGGWSDDDATLLNAADELHDDSRISDSTWQSLAARLTEQQLLDVIFTVGNYHVVAFALNSCGVELDSGVAPAL